MTCVLSHPDDMSRIKELAGFANTFFSTVAPGLEAIYTDTAILGWFLSFHVSRGVRGTTMQAHATTCRKVLEWLESKVWDTTPPLKCACAGSPGTHDQFRCQARNATCAAGPL